MNGWTRTLLCLLAWSSPNCGTTHVEGRPAVPGSGGVQYVALRGHGLFPEGIAAHAGTGELFVGGLASGEIQKVHGGRAEPFKTSHEDGLLNVIGLAVDSARDRLWVCSTSFADPAVPPSLVVFDTRTGRKLAALTLPADGSAHFLNDVDLDSEGNAYATDSFAPTLWRAPVDLSAIEPFVTDGRFAVDPEGFNLNGIVVTPGDRYLVASVPSLSETGRGKLFRIALADRSVLEIAQSSSYAGADGLVVVSEGRLLSIGGVPGLHRLDFDAAFSEARVVAIDAFSDELDLPTTAAVVQNKLWVVNSQLDHFATEVFGDRGAPSLPFEIVGIPLEVL